MAATLANLVSDAMVLVFCSALMFIIMYTAIAPWWKSSIGIALITLDAGIAAILAPATVQILVDRHFAQHASVSWYTFSCLAVVMVAINWRTVILVRDQVRHYKKAAEKEGK